jgi:hypothetical protein
MEATTVVSAARVPWNKGKSTGQKPPLKLKEIQAIRIRLQLAARTRDLAMFNLRAVQLLLGRTKLESTVRYLGIEVDDALEMAEQTEV